MLSPWMAKRCVSGGCSGITVVSASISYVRTAEGFGNSIHRAASLGDAATAIGSVTRHAKQVVGIAYSSKPRKSVSKLRFAYRCRRCCVRSVV